MCPGALRLATRRSALCVLFDVPPYRGAHPLVVLAQYRLQIRLEQNIGRLLRAPLTYGAAQPLQQRRRVIQGGDALEARRDARCPAAMLPEGGRQPFSPRNELAHQGGWLCQVGTRATPHRAEELARLGLREQ